MSSNSVQLADAHAGRPSSSASMPQPEKVDTSTSRQDDDGELERAPAGKKGIRFWLTFLSLLLATFEAALEQTALATALPTISTELSPDGGHGSDYSWYANIYMLASAAFIPWSGGLANIFGRKPIMLASLALFSLGSLVCALAKNPNTMMAGRGIQGAGGGIIFAIVEILLSDLVPLAERGVYQGAFSATWSIASAAGPLVGGAFAGFYWQGLFWINLPMSAVVALVVIFCVKLKAPEGSAREKFAKMDWIGNLIFIPAVSVLILGLVWGGTSYPWRSAQVIAPIVCGAIGLIVWFYVEAHWVKVPTVPFKALLNRTSLVGYITTFLHGIVAMGVYYYWPAYFQAAKAETTIISAVDILPVVLLVSPMAMLTGLSVNGWQVYKGQNIAGWILLTIGVGLLSLSTATTSKAGWVLLPMVSALGIGIGYAAPVFAVLAPLPPALAGQALAFQMLVRTLAMVLGITIGSTTLTNVLADKLPQAFLDLAGGASGAYDAITEIHGLEEPLKMQVRVAFAQGLRVVWLVMIPFAGVGFVVSLFMRNLTLAATVDDTFGMKEKKRSVDLERIDEAQRKAAVEENAQQLPIPMAEAVAVDQGTR
ncbi:hypothetical protein JCM8097_002047 [Rhodosporidiobolus ruineniae]